jgi:hypothetical protein
MTIRLCWMGSRASIFQDCFGYFTIRGSLSFPTLDLALHPTSFHCRNYGLYSASADGWRSILLLADMWRFDTIRKLAIEKLGEIPLDPVDQLEISNRFKIESKWSANAMKALCARKELLTNDEVLRIGVMTSLKIARTREGSFKAQVQSIKAEMERCKIAKREVEQMLKAETERVQKAFEQALREGHISLHCTSCKDKRCHGATMRFAPIIELKKKNSPFQFERQKATEGWSSLGRCLLSIVLSSPSHSQV